MYAVNFIFKNNSVSMGFTFKAHKNAHDLVKQAEPLIGTPGGIGKGLVIKDDFACIGKVDMAEVAAVVMNDLKEEFDKQGEVGLMQARAQAKAQQMAKSDHALRIIQPANSIVT